MSFGAFVGIVELSWLGVVVLLWGVEFVRARFTLIDGRVVRRSSSEV